MKKQTTIRTIIVLAALLPLSIFLFSEYGGNGHDDGDGHHNENDVPRMNSSGTDTRGTSETSDTGPEEGKRHAEHRGLRDEIAHSGVILLDEPYSVDAATRHRMELVLDAYARLRDALVADAPEQADAGARVMAEAVADVPADELRSEGDEAWKQHATLYQRTLREMRHVTTLEEKRSYFAHISEIVYCTEKSFGLGDVLPRVFYCPMAFDGKGAYWLDDSPAVKNPYFGESMRDCGEQVETLGP